MTRVPRPKVMVILGTRPEIVKLAPVATALRAEGARTVVCLTGQHLELAAPFVRLFPMRPGYVLDAMRRGQDLAELTARVITRLDPVIKREQPNAVVVQGDTTSALAGALCAFYRHVPVAHVEAGLRSGSLADPFPEELNRRVITSIATIHYAPTAVARANLLASGVGRRSILVTGNTGIDALLGLSDTGPRDRPSADRVILVTAHRRENVGEPLYRIGRAVRAILARHAEVSVQWCLHPNPEVQRQVLDMLGGVERCTLIQPKAYVDFVRLLARSWLVMTDSGGIQEEVTALGKPVLILRNRTERPEVVAAGNGVLVGSSERLIARQVGTLLRDPGEYRRRARRSNVFGDGRASQRIARHLVRALDRNKRGSDS